MKKKYRFKKYFIIISAVFIIGLIFAYGSRLVHFYLLENKKLNSNGKTISSNYFTDILENTINVLDSSGGLYIDKETYMYKYAADENYLWYSGQLWRILKINDDKTLTIIHNDSISLMQPKFESEDYLVKFLNEFYNKLDQDYLVKFKYCVDTITDIKAITCNTEEEGNITLLDMFTYNKVGNAKSYLNDGTIFWLKNKNEDNNYWYIDSTGAVAIGNGNVAHNIKPIVTLKANIMLISGDGTKNNPYIIKEDNKTLISEALTGEYIKYNDQLWRVLSVSDKSLSALKVECLKSNDECLKYKFGSNINFLNSNIYKYLNTTYYTSLENNDFLVKDLFYNGTYVDYNFESLNESSVEAYIGLPRVSEYYIQNNLDSYLITPNVIETVYTINENGNYYLVNPSSEKNIYPVVNFDINLKITAGNGKIDSPYELSR